MTTPLQDRLSAYWTRWAAEYENNQARRLREPAERAAWEQVWSAALPSPPASVLDLGTGSGHAAFILAGMGYQVTGVDAAAGMIEQARRKAGDSPNPVFRHADARELSWVAGGFDAMTARYFLWTVTAPHQALASWWHALRPGGRLVVVDSLWFPQGLGENSWAAPREASAVQSNPNPASPLTTQARPAPRSLREQHFLETYAGQDPAFPLAASASITRFAECIEAAGFTDVTVTELPHILERDRRLGVAPGHRPQLQYRISATRPLRHAAQTSLESRP